MLIAVTALMVFVPMIIALGTGTLVRLDFRTPPPAPGPLPDSDGAGSAVASVLAASEENSAASDRAPTPAATAIGRTPVPKQDSSPVAAFQVAAPVVDRLAAAGELDTDALDDLLAELAGALGSKER